MVVETVQGNLDATGLRFGVVLPRFNETFGTRLLSGAIDGLLRHGAREDDITVVRVPGTFEVPFAARALAEHRDVDAVIALGVLIRGATSHYERIAAEASRGIGEAGLKSGRPVIYGIVTAENQEQALERCGGKAGNRGLDAALAAVEMANLRRALSDKGRSRRKR